MTDKWKQSVATKQSRCNHASVGTAVSVFADAIYL